MNTILVVESMTIGCFFEDHNTAPKLSKNKIKKPMYLFYPPNLMYNHY